MITAVDSSVIWAILKEEDGFESWEETLLQAAAEGPLVICPIAFSELAPSTPDQKTLLSFLGDLAISYENLTPAAAFAAGQAFKRYRQAGGPRQHLIPDFLIAAQAMAQADRLAAIDRGYLRQWFPRLVLLERSNAS